MKKLLGFITIFFLVFSVIGVVGVSAAGEGFKVTKRDLSIKDKPVYVENEIVVTFQKDARALEGELAGKFGLIKKERKLYPELFTVYNTGKSKRNIKDLIEEIKKVPGVASVERNAYVYALGVPNDPFYSYQWHMKRIDMEDVWDYSQGDGVTVAVIDSGVKQSLADMANTSFVPGWDFVNNDNDPTDDNGHGSHVAGTVAQSTNNSIGVAGVAYKAKIMPIKVLNANGQGNTTLTALGIKWAVDHGADIINLSLGGSGYTQTLLDEVNNAWNNGVVVICAAGNDGVSTPFYPAAFDNSISVSATDYADALASYSNYGSTIDIAAPGGDLNADLNGDGYADGVLQQTVINGTDNYYFMDGTSMASPHVAGVAAMMKSVNPALTNDDIKSKLYSSATDLGAAGWDNQFGWGLLNAKAAMDSANIAPVAGFFTNVVKNHVQFFDNSSDTNGEVVKWHWNFGDSSIALGKDVSHNYSFAGTYNVSLTVTDNHGGINQRTVPVTIDSVSPPLSHYAYVKSITYTKSNFSANSTITACITVYDHNNQPVNGATVYLFWDGYPYPIGAIAVTDIQGKAYHTNTISIFDTKKVRVAVTNVQSQYIYYPQENQMDRLYINIP